MRYMAFFHNLVYISGESDRIFVKILSQMYPSTRKSLLNFGGNLDPHPGHILLRGCMRFVTSHVVSALCRHPLFTTDALICVCLFVSFFFFSVFLLLLFHFPTEIYTLFFSVEANMKDLKNGLNSCSNSYFFGNLTYGPKIKAP